VLKIYQNLPLQDPPKFAQIGIFGLKIYAPSGNPAAEPQDSSREHSMQQVAFVSLTHLGYTQAGRPDWTNLRPLDDCLLRDSFLKLQKQPMFKLIFSLFSKNMPFYGGQFFHELIWSPA
jgi:hypothetical protein